MAEPANTLTGIELASTTVRMVAGRLINPDGSNLYDFGNNANGYYYQLPSGIMICNYYQANIDPVSTSADPSGYRANLDSWSFPQAFDQIPTVFISGSLRNGAALVLSTLNAFAITTQGCSMAAFSSIDFDNIRDYNLMAIGEY